MIRSLPLALALTAGLGLPTIHAGDAPVLPAKSEVAALIGKGQAFLLSQQQPDGALVPGGKFTLGISALALETVAMEPAAVPASDPRLAKAIGYLKGFVQADGSIQDPNVGVANYTTSLGLRALLTVKAADPALVKKAQEFLLGIQNSTPGSICEGGIGYGSKGAGHEDLNNTTFALGALTMSGMPSSDPRMQAALAFLQRCQNSSAVNKLPWVTDDGGAVYSPEESKANGSWNKESSPDAKLVSYGTMTYSLISSYLALELKKDDPRVQAALAWGRANYQFDRNPGLKIGKDKDGKPLEQQGLFYYYLIMARTYHQVGQGPMQLPDGRTVDWRADLFAAIKQRAKPGASPDQAIWINEADRWEEKSPHLVTSYVVQALKLIHASL